jgi:ATP adenylyltransferase/5',5'''-P-1,P-4-tetraphosphate phosphorylase II
MTNDPLLPPYAKHVEVAHLSEGADHYVFVNIGQVVRGHVVVSSANPKAIQGDDLDMSDCHALAQVVTGFDQRGLAYYNAGIESGCSQMHKHMQFAPVLNNPFFKVMRAGERLPWRYFKAELADITPNEIRKAYEDLKSRMRHNGSYNVLLGKGTLALVPRRRANHTWGISINSLGVAGHFFIWEHSSKNIETWLIQVLKDVYLPW